VTPRLGTRGSALATTQSGLVARDLEAAAGLEPGAVQLVRIRTEGDRLTGSLAGLSSTGVFVAALRDAVRDGRCDLAVHSFKDLPTGPADGLRIAAVPERADPRDALCGRDGLSLDALPAGARVGTGSPRRAAQLLAVRPDLEVVDLRGNVDTRLARVRGHERPGDAPGDLDAVVLAAAGLDRLGRLDAATEILDPSVMMPSPAQGALAVETASGGATTVGGATGGRTRPLAPRPEGLDAALDALDHLPTRIAVTAERALLATLEAGCAAPIGALARVEASADGPVLTLDAVVCSADGGRRLTASETIPLPPVTEARLAAADSLGTRVAARLVQDGAADLAPLAAARTLAGWTVVVPRAGAWGERVGALLRARGAVPVVLPLVEFAPAADLDALDRAMDDLAGGRYDWLAVTSATTVDAIAERAAARALGSLGALLAGGGHAPNGEPGPARPTRVAAVGPATARAMAEHGITPALVSTERSAAGLASELGQLTGTADDARRPTVLVPHSDIAEATLTEGLRAAGWAAEEVVAYRTVTGSPDPASTADAWGGVGPHAVLLTSPSTARAVVDRLGTPPAGTVICCLGPRTAEYARRQGLAADVVADDPTVEQLVIALVRHAEHTLRAQDSQPTQHNQEAPA